MPALSPILHAARPRAAWRFMLLLLTLVVCWFAFTPRPPGLNFDQADKLQHIAAFLALSICSALSLPPGRWSLPAAGLAMLALGIFIELVQMHIPQRTAEWQDVVADSVGVIAGLALVALARRCWPLNLPMPAGR